MKSAARQCDIAYRTRDEAIHDGVGSDMIVHTADDFFYSEDDLIRCEGCDAPHTDRANLNYDLHCEECAQKAHEEQEHIKSLNIDWSNSRGCNMGRSW